MALTKISTGGFKDDAASQAKIADEAIDEARLQVSNAGTNGQFLSKQSGNTGGLTWATVTVPDSDKIEEGNTSIETVDTGSDGHVKITTEGSERVRITNDGKVGIGVTPSHPLHIKTQNGSGDEEVKIEAESGYDANLLLDTSNGGGAAAQIFFQVDGTTKGGIEYVNNAASASVNNMIFRTTTNAERLRLGASGQIGIAGANYGTSGQVLTSGGSGAAPSWAAVPPAGNTFTAVAEGAIANNKAVQLRTDGKVEQIAATTQVTPSPIIDTNGVAQGGTGSGYHDFGPGVHDNMAYDPESDMTLLIWKNTNDNVLYYKMYESTGGGYNEINAARTAFPDNISGTDFACCSLSNKRFAVCCEDNSKMKIQIGQVNSDGTNWTWGSVYYIDGQSGTAGDYREPHMVAIGDDRIAFYARANNSTCKWNTNTPGFLVGDVTSTNVWNYRSWSAVDGNHNCDGQFRDITYDSTNDIIAFVWRRDSTDTNDYIMGARVSSGTSPTFTLGTPLQHSTGTTKNRIRYNSVKNVFVTVWQQYSLFYMKAHTIDSTTLAVTSGTGSSWNHGMGFNSMNLVISNEGGAFGVVVGTDNNTRIVSATFAGTNNLTTTVNGSSNSAVCSNYGSVGEACCVYIAHTGHVLSVVRSGSGSAAGMVLGTNETTSQVSNLVGNDLYVGFADQAYTNGQTATIKTYGNNVDTLSGLTPGTKYYVQGDGTVGTSAATPTTRAGIAIAANKLLIQEPTNWGG